MRGENIGNKWPRQWYLEEVTHVARHLLGAYLVHVVGGKVYAGRIVETEAYGGTYRGQADDGSHAYRGPTQRNEAMFQLGGCSYVYQIYGMYYCMNVVTGPAGKGEAVLIRAVEPVLGIGEMYENRKRGRSQSLYHLADGPGKLCQAMEITKEQNKLNLGGSELYIAEPVFRHSISAAHSPRIHIDYAEKGKTFPWRYYIKKNRFVSHK